MDHYRVLIVEDRQTLAEQIAESLQREADICIAGIAFNGAEAVEQTWKSLPDVILMDLNMPVMDGIEATRLIKQAKPEVEIVVLTVLEDDPHLFEALKAGAKGYLLKDGTSEQIAEAIRAVTRGESAIPPALGRRVLAEFERLSQQSSALLDLFEKLSGREREVLAYLAEGKTNPQIAEAMYIELTTVKSHMTAILRKLHVNSRFEAADIARRSGLSGPAPASGWKTSERGHG